ncbi:hypothetical protein J6590_033521 [Homalodisca vitripennis]|nr:hypothetical protein J6590_033521 [Homalodisca vitripennis]
MKWLMEFDLNADLNDDEIIEETPDSGKTDGDEIKVAASSFKVSCNDAVPAAATLRTQEGSSKPRAGGLLARTGSLSGHPSKQQPRSTLLDSVISR